MDAGKYAHRNMPRVIANKHFINLENCAQLPIEYFGRDVREIQINLILAPHPVALQAYLKYLPCGYVPGNEIAVSGILLLQKIETLFFRNLRSWSCIALLARNPHASTFAACRLRHQPQFVFTGD